MQPVINLDDIASCAGVGRDVLCERIRLLVRHVRQLQDDLSDDAQTLARVTASNVQLAQQLTVVQQRCSSLLTEKRVLESAFAAVAPDESLRETTLEAATKKWRQA